MPLSLLASLPIGAAVDRFSAQAVVAVFGVLVAVVVLLLSPIRLRRGRVTTVPEAA